MFTILKRIIFNQLKHEKERLFLVYPPSSTIGIVVGEDEVTGEIKFYIGVGSGVDEGADERMILEMGARIHPELLADFFERNGKFKV